MQPLADAHSVTLLPPVFSAGRGYVHADNQRLKQVVINLVSNAIKYNRPGGEVRVAVGGGDGRRARADQRRGHGPGDRRRSAGAAVRPLRAARRGRHRRPGHGPRARAVAQPDRGDGRHDRRDEHGRRGQHVLDRPRRAPSRRPCSRRSARRRRCSSCASTASRGACSTSRTRSPTSG